MYDLTRAMSCYEEALMLARQARRSEVEACVLGDLGNVARRQGNVTQATVLLRQALGLKRALGAHRQIEISLEDLVGLAAAEGQGERAACLLGAATALRALIGAPQPIPKRTARSRQWQGRGQRWVRRHG